MGIIPPSSPGTVVVVTATVAVLSLVLVIRPTNHGRPTRASRYLLAGLAGATLWAVAQVAMLGR